MFTTVVCCVQAVDARWGGAGSIEVQSRMCQGLAPGDPIAPCPIQ